MKFKILKPYIIKGNTTTLKQYNSKRRMEHITMTEEATRDLIRQAMSQAIPTTNPTSCQNYDQIVKPYYAMPRNYYADYVIPRQKVFDEIVVLWKK